MILLDLDNCQLGYCPTSFQLSRFPEEYRGKLRIVFDGVDTDLWHRRERTGGSICGVNLPPRAKLVTYCARGFESMRGFDLFMRAVRRITQAREDVHVLIVGTDRVAYGGDEEHTSGKSFKDWTLALEDVRGYAADRVHFVGRQTPIDLAKALSASDAHLYLTVPFVLSWSLINAMACGAPVVCGDTAPVRDAVTDGETGVLADFFDPNDLTDKTLALLDDPVRARRLGDAASALVRERFAMDVTLPAMRAMYAEAATITSGLEIARPRPASPRTSIFAG